MADVCKPGSCPANQLCTPSQFSTVGFVCSPPNYFKVTINREFYRSARGYVPVGDITASRRTLNSSELENIFIVGCEREIEEHLTLTINVSANILGTEKRELASSVVE